MHLQHGGGGQEKADEDPPSVDSHGVPLRDGGGGHDGLRADPGGEEGLQTGGASVQVNHDEQRSAKPTHTQGTVRSMIDDWKEGGGVQVGKSQGG